MTVAKIAKDLATLYFNLFSMSIITIRRTIKEKYRQTDRHGAYY